MLSETENEVVFNHIVQEARTDFKAFCYLMFPPQENPSFTDIQIGAVHERLCDIVQQVDVGELGRRQTVSLPPQHGKSTFVTILQAAWKLGKHDGISIGISAFSSTLVQKFSREIKAITDRPIYQRVFPDMTLGQDKVDNYSEREWDNGSTIQCKTTGSKFTGRRIDLMIIDDPHAGRSEAESKTDRSKVHTWYFGDVVSRIHPTTAIFIIATRWHPDDLIGHLTSDSFVDAAT